MSDTENAGAPTEPAPEAATEQGQEQQQETFDAAYVKKLRDENASWRQKAKAAQEAAEAAKTAAERAKLDELERVKAEKADVEKRAQEAEARAVAAERRAALAGKVADPAAALKLIDPDQHLAEDGSVNVDALLETYPFLKPAPSGPASIGGANPRGQKDPALMSDEEFFRSRIETKG